MPVLMPFRSLAIALLTATVLALPVRAEPFGTYLKPFAATSPWNARPVGAVLGDYEIPRSDYPPTLAEGKWSTGVFLASDADKPVTVIGEPGSAGVWDADAEVSRPRIVIPRWPANVIPASGSDGHADIVDPISGIVHSFFKLKNINGEWHTKQYAWTRLGGRGWGDPAHYYQGARAAAVPSMGGVIRTHEVNDGDKLFRHALAMSLTFNALSPSPTYVFPATAADRGAEKTNFGRIPEGALLMLPPDYDTASIKDARLRKVADTLKVYGAYVVDRNHGTPFVIYVENGTNLGLHKPVWNNTVVRELDRMRAALRQVVAVDGWLDGNDKPMETELRLNLLSMRGPWKVTKGEGAAGNFDTWQQAVVFTVGSAQVEQINTRGNSLHPVTWARPQPGLAYRLSVTAKGGGALRVQLYESAALRQRLYDSGMLTDGQSVVFNWPEGQGGATVIVRGGGAEPTSVSGTLVAVDPPAPMLRR